MKAYLKDWNYPKHAALCVGVYAVLFALDMTVGYAICKRVLNKVNE